MLLLSVILLPMILGGALLLLRPRDGRTRAVYVMASVCLSGVAGVWALLSRLGAPGQDLLRIGGKLSFSLGVDGLSALFGVMVCVLWPLATLYALEYMSREGGENRFFAFYLISFGVTLGIACSANLVTMYLFYELLTLATLPLVMHAMDGKARYAGKVYLIYSMSGAALGFISMVFLLSYGGDHFQLGGVLAGVEPSQTLLLAYVAGFFGFGVKAAVFPGFRWLLRASVAPTPVTALLHAVAVVKTGVFAVTRLTWYGYGVDFLSGTWAQSLVMGAAVFTIVFGSAKALRTQHLKRRLAFSTVSNLSYVLLGVTLSLIHI